MRLSIIIPTYNEEATIEKLVRYLLKNGGQCVAEVIVADAGSADDTVQGATAAGAKVVISPQKGRAAQMNYGASLASGEILYFVHADSFPPDSFASDILQAIEDGYELGRYQSRFDSRKPILRINEWFTRFDLFICMGGDQTLFIRAGLFRSLGGFRQEMLIMEEYEFCRRAREGRRYKILPGHALISARKYEKNSWLRVQLANRKIVQLYKKGATQEAMVAEYKRRLKW